MKEIRGDGKYTYVFSKHLEPLATVKDGESAILYTEDCFEGRVRSESDLPTKVQGKYLNPQTGPIYVEGAKVGDTLKVTIENIEFTRDFAVSAIIPNFGGLVATNFTRTLNEPLPEKVYLYKYDGKKFTYNERLSFEPIPFMGTIATAPDLESISALTPFDQGGNMDVPDVKVGNVVYLPVRVDGAYFFTGDCHALQGEGEVCGCALEISAKVQLKFEVIKNKQIKWPRIESKTEMMAVGSARPMEDAARIAVCEMVDILQEYGYSQMDAYQLFTQVGKLYIGNMVDTTYSVVAKIDKKYLTK